MMELKYYNTDMNHEYAPRRIWTSGPKRIIARHRPTTLARIYQEALDDYSIDPEAFIRGGWTMASAGCNAHAAISPYYHTVSTECGEQMHLPVLDIDLAGPELIEPITEYLNTKQLSGVIVESSGKGCWCILDAPSRFSTCLDIATDAYGELIRTTSKRPGISQVDERYLRFAQSRSLFLLRAIPKPGSMPRLVAHINNRPRGKRSPEFSEWLSAFIDHWETPEIKRLSMIISL